MRRWGSSLKEGDIVSFKHHGYLTATKKPKFPSLHRVRTDIVWQDVLDHWKDNKTLSARECLQHPHPLFLSPSLTSPFLEILFEVPRARPKRKNVSKGHWKDVSTRREFFCKFAQERGFDPLVASNWSKVSRTQIYDNGGTLLKYYRTLQHALQDAFPELDFTQMKPSNIPPPLLFASVVKGVEKRGERNSSLY